MNKVFIVHALKGKEIGGAAIVVAPLIREALLIFEEKHPLIKGEMLDIFECKELSYNGKEPCIVADYIFSKVEEPSIKVYAVERTNEDGNLCGSAFVATTSETAALKMICKLHASVTETTLKASEITDLCNSYTSATIIIDEIEEEES